MDLDEFTSPRPKPWLRINGDSADFRFVTGDAVHVGPGFGGASAAQYSMTSSTTALDVSGPVSVTAGAAHTGTLRIPPLPLGAVVRITAGGLTNTAQAGDVCNFGLTIDGIEATGQTHISTGGGAIGTAGTEVRSSLTIVEGGAAVASISVSEWSSVGPGGGNTTLQTAQFDYDASVPHVFDIAVYFSRAAPGNNFTCYSCLCELVNAN